MAVKYNFKCRVVNHKEAEQYRNLACTFEWNYDYDLPDQDLIKEIKKYYPTVVPPFVIIYGKFNLNSVQTILTMVE